MSGKILLFGFDSLLHILALEAAVKPFGAELVPVGRSDYLKPLAALAGLDDPEPTGQTAPSVSLGGKMIVLCGLEERLESLLPALNQAGAGPDCLKAVLTARNRTWNALRLFEELQRERQAMEKGRRL